MKTYLKKLIKPNLEYKSALNAVTILVKTRNELTLRCTERTEFKNKDNF